ncbi:MAG: trypsin-like peptidase domain-containing protein [Actinomycetes bacterium]
MADNKSHYNTQFLGDEFTLQEKYQVIHSNKLKSKPTRLAIALVAILGPVLGAVTGIYAYGGGVPFLTNTQQVVVNNPGSVNWVTGAAVKALPSVVTLSVSSSSTGATGSGVVLSSDGYILTNAHVVTIDGETSKVTIEVKTSSDKIYRAVVVGIDPTNDLAVIKAAGSGFTPIEFTDSSSINVGDSAVAIGAPLGYDATVTAGVVSALHRTIQVASSEVPQDGGSSLELWNSGSKAAPVNLDVIQTDAAINPGNSGGALVNDLGQLIGINVAIASATATSAQVGSIGVGFAIPSNVAKRISTQLIKDGKISHGLLGALVSDEPSSEGKGSFTVGAKVQQLTAGGAAEMAGLKVGDIVIGCDGQTIDSSSKLTAAIRAKEAFATVTLKVLRGKDTLDFTATLGDASSK